ILPIRHEPPNKLRARSLSALGALCSSLLLISTAAALEPVRLSPYPQKVRTFFSLSDTNVPAGLRTNAVPLPAGRLTATARAGHDRYGLTASSHLAVAGDCSSNRTHDNDNDGLWTAMYAAAECFRYAVTKSPEALANARKAMDAILFLEEVAGRRGFPARSF